MTLAIAWRRGNTVLMAADTLLTTPSPSIDAHIQTTFGTPTAKPNQHFDDGFKLVRLDGFQATYCGDVAAADAFLFAISRKVQDGYKTEDAILEQIYSVGGNGTLQYSVLFSWVQDSTVRLIYLDGSTGSHRAVDSDELIAIGSGRSIVNSQLTMLRDRCPSSASPEQALVWLLAHLQLRAHADPRLGQCDAGGTFFGLAVTPSGVHWMPRIAYAEALPSGELDIRLVGVENEFLYTTNTNTHTSKIQGVSWLNDNPLIVAKIAIHNSLHDINTIPYWVFFRPTPIRLLVCRRNSEGLHSSFFIKKHNGRNAVSYRNNVKRDLDDTTHTPAFCMYIEADDGGCAPTDWRLIVPTVAMEDIDNPPLLARTLLASWEYGNQVYSGRFFAAALVYGCRTETREAWPYLVLDGDIEGDVSFNVQILVPLYHLLSIGVGDTVCDLHPYSDKRAVLICSKSPPRKITLEHTTTILRQCNEINAPPTRGSSTPRTQ